MNHDLIACGYIQTVTSSVQLWTHVQMDVIMGPIYAQLPSKFTSSPVGCAAASCWHYLGWPMCCSAGSDLVSFYMLRCLHCKICADGQP